MKKRSKINWFPSVGICLVVTPVFLVAKSNQSLSLSGRANSLANLKREANKFINFYSTTLISNVDESLKKVKQNTSGDALNIKNEFQKIAGYTRPDDLASDVKIQKVVVKHFNQNKQQVVYTLTLARNEEIVEKDITVTFETPYLEDTSTPLITENELDFIFGFGVPILFLLASGLFIKIRKKMKKRTKNKKDF